jgi:hypothetical protein
LLEKKYYAAYSNMFCFVLFSQSGLGLQMKSSLGAKTQQSINFAAGICGLEAVAFSKAEAEQQVYWTVAAVNINHSSLLGIFSMISCLQYPFESSIQVGTG